MAKAYISMAPLRGSLFRIDYFPGPVTTAIDHFQTVGPQQSIIDHLVIIKHIHSPSCRKQRRDRPRQH